MWAQSEAVSPLAHLILIPPDLDARCARNLVRLSAQGLAKHMHSIQHLQRFLFSILLATGLLSVSASAQCVPQWSRTATSWRGGSFSTAGSVPAEGIARWDGTNWSAMGVGESDGWVRVVRIAA
jgi:hypothetical protein